MNNQIKLVKGKAVIIRGAEGSGKSTLAMETAKAYGTVMVAHSSRLNHPSGHVSLIRSKPNVVILEETKIDDYVLELVKYYISSKTIEINDDVFDVPYFIICTNDKEPIQLPRGYNQRFTVVDL